MPRRGEADLPRRLVTAEPPDSHMIGAGLDVQPLDVARHRLGHRQAISIAAVLTAVSNGTRIVFIVMTALSSGSSHRCRPRRVHPNAQQKADTTRPANSSPRPPPHAVARRNRFNCRVVDPATPPRQLAGWIVFDVAMDTGLRGHLGSTGTHSSCGPMRFQRRGGRKRIVAPDGSERTPSRKPQPDGTLVKALARAHRWQRMLEGAIRHAGRDGRRRTDQPVVRVRVLRLTLLAPDIVERILDGRPRPGSRSS